MAAPAADEYLAKPPTLCCALGSIHAGTPTGTEQQVAGIRTYVARPAAADGNGHVVFYFPDVWGLSTNARLVMDGLSAAGYTALGMDYFCGDDIAKYRSAHDAPPPPDFDMAAWRAKHVAFATANVPVWAAAAKAVFGRPDGASRYACVGYCFGAPYVLGLLATDGVAAGAFAHPSQLTEEQLRAVKREWLLVPLPRACASLTVRTPAPVLCRARPRLSHRRAPPCRRHPHGAEDALPRAAVLQRRPRLCGARRPERPVRAYVFLLLPRLMLLLLHADVARLGQGAEPAGHHQLVRHVAGPHALRGSHAVGDGRE